MSAIQKWLPKANDYKPLKAKPQTTILFP